MTTHEMILLCPSLQGVRRCILLCLMLRFATFAAFWKIGPPPANGLKRTTAYHSMPQHSKFFWGTVGACLAPTHGVVSAESSPSQHHPAAFPLSTGAKSYEHGA